MSGDDDSRVDRNGPFLVDHHGIQVELAYLRVRFDEPLYIFGVAGTDEQFSGDDSVNGLDLPDGQYRLQTLYLLPL